MNSIKNGKDDSPALANSLFSDVEGWTENTLQALERLKLATSQPNVRGTGVSLAIPIDSAPTPVLAQNGRDAEDDNGVALAAAYQPLRRKTSQRDSMRRREALLKGNEGSRRRQKWENDRLIGNPHVQPPLPHDWEVHPTYPVHTVPYYLASLWDAKQAEKERSARKRKSSKSTSAREVPKENLGQIPKGLKDTIKRSRAAKSLLQELEQEIRTFVETYNDSKELPKSVATCLEDDDDDFAVVDEDDLTESMVVLKPEKLVFHSPEDDRNAGFGRYLVHSLGAYYGLDTWSVTVGHPARREAYVGFKEAREKTTMAPQLPLDLPRPMWARV